MPIGAETFLSPALQPVFEKLFSMGEDLLSKLSGGELAKTLKQWKRRLKMIEAVLIDAEQKQFYSNAVKTWLDDLEGVAFDMEDILEHFAIQVDAHDLNKMGQEDFGIFGSFSNMSLSTLFNPINPDIQSEIDDINERLEDIQTQTRDFGLYTAHVMQQQTIQIQTEDLRNQRESTYIVGERRIYGRDGKKQEIIAQLLKDDQSNKKNYVVIPIVGMGGIGKTTLAQYVYNDEHQLKGCFDIKAWVCVSDVFDVKRITTTIIRTATNESVGDFRNLNEAQNKLKQVLMGKKFLIVLDDIWNESYDSWIQLQTPFQLAAKGSRVIMTTRNEKIARMMSDNSNNSNNLEGLSDDDCWCLFQQHFSNDDFDLAEMRDDIIAKCKALPLAAKALGGLLKTTDNKRQCQRILESNVWSEEDRMWSGKSSVLPVLRLSYDNLPSHLKRMFAYCSIFPKDYIFQEMQVVLLWMAQGFLPENQPGGIEDMGHKYFRDLVLRSLFEVSQHSEEGFIMHDLIHDLALWAAGDICYVIGTSDKPQRDLNRIRHVSLTRNATTLGNQLPMASQWRTFYCPSNDESVEDLDLIRKFRYMRTLILCSDIIYVLPECIGDLKHLRYLVLNFKSLKELPKSINNLWNLQTLGLCCSTLKHVPDIGFLGKLRHLFFSGTPLQEMPRGIGELTNLRSLEKFVLGDGCGERIRDLKNLNHLHGKLTISGLESVLKVEDAKEAQLDKKNGLDELCLIWGIWRDEVDDNTRTDVLEQLKPHSSIKQLVLNRYRGLTFPTWLGNPCFSMMVGISLEDSEKCEYLPPLGQLPSLKNLFIGGMHDIKEIGAEFYGDLRCQNPLFPVLESLKFEKMGSWEKWLHSPAHDHAFPCLKKLSIEHCDSLKGELPHHLPSLRELIIKLCQKLSVSLQSLPSLRELEIKDCKELSVLLQSLPLLEVLESGRCDILFTDGAGCSSDMGAECLKVPCELAYLITLTIVHCQSRLSLPGLLLPALQYLKFWGCQNMESLPSQLHKYTSLKKLTIGICPKIKEFPEGGLPINLEDLEIKKVNIKKREQELAVHHLHSLRSLNFSNIGMTPEDLSLPSSLSDVSIYGSQNLKTISSCTLESNLTKLTVHNCPMFESFVGNFTLLSKLVLQGCPSLISSLEGLLLPALQHLQFRPCQSMESLPRQLHRFTSLKSLEIVYCPKLQGFPEGGLPRNLTRLELTGRINTDKPIREWGLHLLSSLESLVLVDMGSSSTDSVECIPSPNLQLPSSLSELVVGGFPNLETISCTSFPNMTALRIRCCPKFQSFGDNGLPPKLHGVEIEECELLEPHLKIDARGPIYMDWCRYSLL